MERVHLEKLVHFDIAYEIEVIVRNCIFFLEGWQILELPTNSIKTDEVDP